jgi:PEP-CTERM motif-containing protein
MKPFFCVGELIMRNVVFGLFALVAMAVPSKAALIPIDLLSNASFLPAPTACFRGCTTGFETPLFQFAAGDTVDFGTVTIGPTFQFDGFVSFIFGPALVVGSGLLTPIDLASVFLPSPILSCAPPDACSDFSSRISEVPDRTFDLLFTLPASGEIQIAWSGHLVNYVAPVPEPSTWAMMILGFVGLSFVAYRRKKAILSAV